MITSAERLDRTDRIIWIALVLSLLLHVIVGLLVIFVNDRFAQMVAHLPAHRFVKQSPDEVVTLSSAIHLEKRARPAAGHPARRAPESVTRPQPRSVPVQPQVAQLPQPVVVPRPVTVPKPVEPAPRRHELAKYERKALPQARPTHPKLVAFAPHERTVAEQPRTPREAQEPTRPAHLSQAQLAQIERDLAEALAQSRSDQSTISDAPPVEQPAATKRYSVDFSGLAGDMRGYQGVCYPLKGWLAGGYNYYYVSCRTVHPDGLTREEPVPWPVRFRPEVDPFDPSDSRLPPGSPPMALSPPLPGWKPSPGERIDPDLVDFLRNRGYSI